MSFSPEEISAEIKPGGPSKPLRKKRGRRDNPYFYIGRTLADLQYKSRDLSALEAEFQDTRYTWDHHRSVK